MTQLDSYVTNEDLDRMYATLAGRLERIVRLDVRASDVVIEDACQFAWSRLLHHVGRVRSETALSWLAKTAIHEALKLLRREGREMSLELIAEQAPPLSRTAVSPGADEVFEQHERLESLRSLPERQQRMLWLQGIGLSYEEIALSTGCTPRTVERQLLRAKRTIRAAAAA